MVSEVAHRAGYDLSEWQSIAKLLSDARKKLPADQYRVLYDAVTTYSRSRGSDMVALKMVEEILASWIDTTPSGSHSEKVEKTEVIDNADVGADEVLAAATKETMIDAAAPEQARPEARHDIQEEKAPQIMTIDEAKARIMVIKNEIHELIGNPVALIGDMGSLGKTYMSALLTATRATMGGASGGIMPAMRALEDAYEKLRTSAMTGNSPEVSEPVLISVVPHKSVVAEEPVQTVEEVVGEDVDEELEKEPEPGTSRYIDDGKETMHMQPSVFEEGVSKIDDEKPEQIIEEVAVDVVDEKPEQMPEEEYVWTPDEVLLPASLIDEDEHIELIDTSSEQEQESEREPVRVPVQEDVVSEKNEIELESPKPNSGEVVFSSEREVVKESEPIIEEVAVDVVDEELEQEPEPVAVRDTTEPKNKELPQKVKADDEVARHADNEIETLRKQLALLEARLQEKTVTPEPVDIVVPSVPVPKQSEEHRLIPSTPSVASPAPAQHIEKGIVPSTRKILQTMRPVVDMRTTAFNDRAEKEKAYQADEVTDGLRSLLMSWEIFRGGFLSGKERGLEHPLYKTMQNVVMSDVLAGKFQGAKTNTVISVNDYVNAWRFEQGIEFNPAETFEHYLRRIIHRILTRAGEL